jgi:hypothetical protein
MFLYKCSDLNQRRLTLGHQGHEYLKHVAHVLPHATVHLDPALLQERHEGQGVIPKHLGRAAVEGKAFTYSVVAYAGETIESDLGVLPANRSPATEISCRGSNASDL